MCIGRKFTGYCERIFSDSPPHLIVALGVSDGAFHPPSVGERVHDVAHLPVLVALLLQQLDPHVRDGHAQPVVEPGAALRHRPAGRWHAGYVLKGFCQSVSVAQGFG